MSATELATLIDAFGNHEAKSLVFLSLTDGQMYSSSKLSTKLKRHQGKNPSWPINDAAIYHYLALSFEPAGIVTRVEGNRHYQVSEYGLETAIPLAGLLLDFSLRHQIPLQKVFGTSHNRQELGAAHALLNLRILGELITNDNPLHLSEIVNAVEAPNQISIRKRLKRLSEAGLLNYEPLSRAFTFYRVAIDAPPEEPPPYKTFPTLTHEIWRVLQKWPSRIFTPSELVDILIQEDPAKAGFSRDAFIDQTRKILSHLASYGYVRKKKQQRAQTKLTVNPTQRELANELLAMIRAFSQRDQRTLAYGRELAVEIFYSDSAVRVLMRQALETSALRVYATPDHEVCNFVISTVGAFGKLTFADLQESLRANKVYVGNGRLRRLVDKLADNGQIDLDKSSSPFIINTRMWTRDKQ